MIRRLQCVVFGLALALAVAGVAGAAPRLAAKRPGP